MATTCTCSKQHEKLRMFGTNLNKHILNRATGITNTTEHWYHPVTIIITNSHKNHKDPLSKEKKTLLFFLFFFFSTLFVFLHLFLSASSLSTACIIPPEHALASSGPSASQVSTKPRHRRRIACKAIVEELEHSRLARGTRTRG